MQLTSVTFTLKQFLKNIKKDKNAYDSLNFKGFFIVSSELKDKIYCHNMLILKS